MLNLDHTLYKIIYSRRSDIVTREVSQLGKPIKDMFLKIAETWENEWKDQVGLYNFLNEYVEINDEHHTYVIKMRKRREFV
jgi:hypothetical protein